MKWTKITFLETDSSSYHQLSVPNYQSNQEKWQRLLNKDLRVVKLIRSKVNGTS